MQASDADLLGDIRKLDMELESWRVSLPAKHQPWLCYPPQGHPRQIRRLTKIMLQILTPICCCTPRLRTLPCIGQQERGWLEGASSSLALSVEASRSTMLYLVKIYWYLALE